MTIPEQVRKQSEAIAKHFEGNKTDAEVVEKQDDAGQEVEVAAQTDSVVEAAPESIPNEQRKSDTKDEETFEKRYRTLQGMYNADTARLRSENQQLNHRLTQLEQLLSSLSTTSAQTADVVDKLVTDKDVEEYGDSIEVMRRVAKEERNTADRKLAELEQMFRQMQTSVLPKVEQVAHKQAVSAEQSFWSELSMRVPEWKEVNADAQFHEWLLDVDPLTGLSRQTYLEDAQRNMDINRVVSFFTTWQGQNSQSVAQPTRHAAASQLDKQIAPGRGRSSGTPSTEQSKMYAPKDIQKFFDDVRKGVYRGKEVERDRIERDIFSAQRENRIVANG